MPTHACPRPPPRLVPLPRTVEDGPCPPLVPFSKSAGKSPARGWCVPGVCGAARERGGPVSGACSPRVRRGVVRAWEGPREPHAGGAGRGGGDGYGERAGDLRGGGVRPVRGRTAGVDGRTRAPAPAGRPRGAARGLGDVRDSRRRGVARPRRMVPHAGLRGAGRTPRRTGRRPARERRTGRRGGVPPAVGKASVDTPGGRNGGSRVTVRVAVAGFSRLTRGRDVPSHSAASP